MSKSARSAGAPEPDSASDLPGAELGIDGPVQAVVQSLVNQPTHDPATGRFVRGVVKTFEHSAAFWAAVEPIKASIIERTKRQLGIDDDDGIETLSNTVDAYAEVVLLRKSAFARMCQQGGPVTSKGKTRGLLLAWGQFFDRELRAAERLGLVRKSRRTQSPVEWLQSLEDQHHEPDQEISNDDAQEHAGTTPNSGSIRSSETSEEP